MAQPSSSCSETSGAISFQPYVGGSSAAPTPAPATGGKVLRPPNAWILYRSEKLQEHRGVDLTGKRRPQAELSRIIADQWHNEHPETKKYYEQLAELRKLEHAAQNPGYKYQPRRRRASDAAATTKRRKANSEGEDEARPSRARRVVSAKAARRPSPLSLTIPFAAPFLPAPIPVPGYFAGDVDSLSRSAPAAYEGFMPPAFTESSATSATSPSTWASTAVSETDSTDLTPLLSAGEWPSSVSVGGGSSDGYVDVTLDYFSVAPHSSTSTSHYAHSPIFAGGMYAFEPLITYGPVAAAVPGEGDLPTVDFAFPPRDAPATRTLSSAFFDFGAASSGPVSASASLDAVMPDWWTIRSLRVSRDETADAAAELRPFVASAEADVTLARQQSVSSFMANV